MRYAVIPARGRRNKTNKNLWEINGKPLVWYAIQAAMSYPFDCIIISTNDQAVFDSIDNYISFKDRVKHNITFHAREEKWSKGDKPFGKVLRYIMSEVDLWDQARHVSLFQPTSPFVLPYHIRESINILESEDDKMDVSCCQTITDVDHNNHAINQRIISDKHLFWAYYLERRHAFNKQLKPDRYKFGNFVVTKGSYVKDGICMGKKSSWFHIHPWYSIDIDKPTDIFMAEGLLNSGRVSLPWTSK